jgi:dTDP-4-dehydrorhamnose reductase
MNHTQKLISQTQLIYGISKLAGEFFTKQNAKYYIIRIASLFGVVGASGKGGNFVETMITKANKKETIAVVDDMWMSPTYTRDAAGIIREIIAKGLPFGICYASNAGCCTWFQFAKEIFRLKGVDVSLTPVKTDQIRSKAKRPRFSVLRSIELPKYGIQIILSDISLLTLLLQKEFEHIELESLCPEVYRYAPLQLWEGWVVPRCQQILLRLSPVLLHDV